MCLLRDMHPGPGGHMEMNPSALVPDEGLAHHAHVSHFSTSSRDVHPYGFQLGHEDSKERLEQIRREHDERERGTAAATDDEDEECGAPMLGSIAFEAGTRVNGYGPEEVETALSELGSGPASDEEQVETARAEEEKPPAQETPLAEEKRDTKEDDRPVPQKAHEAGATENGKEKAAAKP